MFIPKINNVLLQLILNLLCLQMSYAQELYTFDIEGSWVLSNQVSNYFSEDNFSTLRKNNSGIKFFDSEGLIIKYDFANSEGEFGVVGLGYPWKIKKVEYIDNNIVLFCYRIFYEYDSERNYVREILSEELEKIKIFVIDNDEIVFDDFSYPKASHFYRISGPAKIPIQNAVINDNRVRLRVKPNLTCDTWALLDKGLPVKIKDKSKEKFEIDGESWYWYKVDNPNYPDGWVYGKYLDIENE